MDRETLEDLIERARAGDGEAMGEIARRYERHVRRHVGQRLSDKLRRRFDSEDVFQSTLTASLGALKGFEYRGEGAFVAWLSAIAERRLLMAVRREHAAKRDVLRDRPLEVAARSPAEQTSPTQGAVSRETTLAVHAALERLPDDQRVVAEMRSREGLTYREIAERLGLANADVARDRYRAAMKKMGEDLAARGGT